MGKSTQVALLAAWLLVTLVERAAASRTPARLAAVVALALVVAGTAAWAWAFTAIYRRPHSRVAASEWIVAHVPAGAAIANDASGAAGASRAAAIAAQPTPIRP